MNPANAALRADQLGVIVNDSDPASVEVGEYYALHRNIPRRNIIHVELPAAVPAIRSSIFEQAYNKVKEQTAPGIQAFALTWSAPYRVGCMSITSAFAMEDATRYCAKGCLTTGPNPYFDSSSEQPYSDFQIRSTMTIAASTVENARFLIDRGIQSDFTNPRAKAYLVQTKDKARNSRAPSFALAKRRFSSQLPVTIVRSEGIHDKFDIMFYFTGTTTVPYLDSVGFLPGAIADHLTSSGGRLTNSRQMSALRWLEAGATVCSWSLVIFRKNFQTPLLQ
jgi:uncharacterized protein (TIGR03790 family)